MTVAKATIVAALIAAIATIIAALIAISGSGKSTNACPANNNSTTHCSIKEG
jgi:hypothetical protein